MATKDITDRQVCEAVRDYQSAIQATGKSAWPYELLAQRTGQSDKACWRAMERTCDRGYLEYGVSLRTAWLTDEGKELLNAPRGGEVEGE